MKYDEIINLPYVKSKTHHHMDILNRASQFAPFSALNGYEEAIYEVGRYVEEKPRLTREEIMRINDRLNYLKDNKNNQVCITYFVKDKTKNGGSIQEIQAMIKKINEVEKKIVLDNGNILKIENIIKIEANVFFEMEFVNF